MGPLRLSSTGQSVISMMVSKAKGGGESDQIQQRHSFNLAGVTRGFIWKPWFSSLSLRLKSGVNYRVVDKSSPDGRVKSDDWSLSSSFDSQLEIFPGSRLPFQLGVSINQDVSQGGGAGSWRYLVDMRQRYSPLHRRSLLFVGGYQWEQATGSGASQGFDFSVSDNVGGHSVGSSFDWQKYGESQSYSLQGDHAYQISAYGLSITNFASRIETVAGETSEAVVNQYHNTLRWEPALYRGLLDYSGNTRLFGSQRQSNADESEQFQLIHSSKVNYRMTPGLRVVAGLGFSYDALERRLFASEDVGIDYSGLGSDVGWWRYDWDAGANMSFSQSSGVETANASASASHRLSRELVRGSDANMRVDLNQGVSSVVYDQRLAPVYAVNHEAFLYRNGRGDEQRYSWTLSVSDSREIDGVEDEAQLLRSELNYSSEGFAGGFLSSDVSAELFRRVDGVGGESIGSAVEGVGNYRTNAVFRVPRLSYIADGRLGLSKNFTSLEGQSQALVMTWRVGNELRWSWGLLSLSGALDFFGARDVADAILHFEIRRQWRPLN